MVNPSCGVKILSWRKDAFRSITLLMTLVLNQPLVRKVFWKTVRSWSNQAAILVAHGLFAMSVQVCGLRIKNAVNQLMGVNLQCIVRTNVTLILFTMHMCRGKAWIIIDHVKLNRIIQTVKVMIQVTVPRTETGGVEETEIDHADFISLYFSFYELAVDLDLRKRTSILNFCFRTCLNILCLMLELHLVFEYPLFSVFCI